VEGLSSSSNVKVGRGMETASNETRLLLDESRGRVDLDLLLADAVGEEGAAPDEAVVTVLVEEMEEARAREVMMMMMSKGLSGLVLSLGAWVRDGVAMRADGQLGGTWMR